MLVEGRRLQCLGSPVRGLSLWFEGWLSDDANDNLVLGRRYGTREDHDFHSVIKVDAYTFGLRPLGDIVVLLVHQQTGIFE